MSDFLVVNHFICRLNVIAPATLVADKIHFIVSADTTPVVNSDLFGYNAYIDIESSDKKFVIDNVFKEMCEFYLPEIQSCIPQPAVTEIVFVWDLDIPFSLNVILARFFNQKRLAKIV